MATAIGGCDSGVFVGRSVDVLVCRATGDSLVRAGQAAQVVVRISGRSPVIAVTAVDVSGLGRSISARLRLLEANAAAIVVLPFVRRWRDLAAPLDEVCGLLSVPRNDIPRVLRHYADAAQLLRSELASSVTTPARPSRPVPAITSARYERTQR
ncbi:hypothetical protein [Pseudonocardia sp. GCM10023141]|uniref:hypothetical protein n=1 Tax=Pseudonocardia sp. GCM10023141 TaxID=3252653 RepID=UPI0036122D0E